MTAATTVPTKAPSTVSGCRRVTTGSSRVGLQTGPTQRCSREAAVSSELEPFQEARLARCLGHGPAPLPVVERHRAVGPDVGDARDLWRGGQGAQQEGPHRGVVGGVDVAREDRLGDVGQLVAHPLQPGRHGVDHRVQRELGAVTQEAGGVVPRAEIAKHDGRHGREQD